MGSLQIEYSIDMLRLSAKLSPATVEGVLNSYVYHPHVTYWESTNLQKFRHNWSFACFGDTSIYVAYKHNRERPSDRYNYTVEFNPNKIGFENDFLIRLFSILPRGSIRSTFISSFDVAIDIPVDISQVYVDSMHKRDFRLFSKGGSDITYYIGDRRSEVSCKVYNKSLEAGLPYPLTRFEITIRGKFDINKFSIDDVPAVDRFPRLLLLGDTDVFTDTEEQIFILGLLHNRSLLNRLSRYKKKKWEEKLSRVAVVQPSSEEIFKCLKDKLNQIFQSS